MELDPILPTRRLFREINLLAGGLWRWGACRDMRVAVNRELDTLAWRKFCRLCRKQLLYLRNSEAHIIEERSRIRFLAAPEEAPRVYRSQLVYQIGPDWL